MAYLPDYTFVSCRVPVELRPLVSTKLESGYVGVYRADSETKRWRAKVFQENQGSAETPVEAAKIVLAWWQSCYGEHWLGYFRRRFQCPWSTVRVRNPRGLIAAQKVGNGKKATSAKAWQCLSATSQAYRLRVSELGRVKYLPPPHGRADVFASRDDAVWYYQRWAYERWGLFAKYALRCSDVSSPG